MIHFRFNAAAMKNIVGTCVKVSTQNALMDFGQIQIILKLKYVTRLNVTALSIRNSFRGSK